MTDLEIMYHRFSHRNIKSKTGDLAKELGMTTTEYNEAVERGMKEEQRIKKAKEQGMERKLKILKATLLLLQVNKYCSKEERIAEYERLYDDEMLDKEIESLRNPTYEDENKDNYYEDYEDKEEYYRPSCENRDYSPSNPWDAPGMSIRDFI